MKRTSAPTQTRDYKCLAGDLKQKEFNETAVEVLAVRTQALRFVLRPWSESKRNTHSNSLSSAVTPLAGIRSPGTDLSQARLANERLFDGWLSLWGTQVD